MGIHHGASAAGPSGTSSLATRLFGVTRDFSVFAQPGFWIALALLGLLFAAGVTVIASVSTYPVPA